MCRMLHSRLRFLAISAGARCGGPSRPLQLTRPGLEHQVWACHSCGAARIENHSNQSSRGDYCAARMTKASVLSSYPTVSSTNSSPTVWPSSATAMKVASSWSYVTDPCTNIAATSCPSAPKTTCFRPPASLTYCAASARVVTIAGIPFCWCFGCSAVFPRPEPNVAGTDTRSTRQPCARRSDTTFVAARHIAVPSPTRSFETLISRLFRDNVGGPPLDARRHAIASAHADMPLEAKRFSSCPSQRVAALHLGASVTSGLPPASRDATTARRRSRRYRNLHMPVRKVLRQSAAPLPSTGRYRIAHRRRCNPKCPNRSQRESADRS